MIEVLLTRLSRAKELDEIVLATTKDPRDKCLVDHVAHLGYKTFRGSEDDVLERYLGAARATKADVVVRITGDCPLVDPELVDEAVRRFRAAEVDYLSNTAPPTYPDGLDVEVLRFSALERASAETDNPHDREHVTPYLWEFGRFTFASMRNNEDLSDWRWSVDEAADFEVVTNIFAHFAPRLNFGWREIAHLRRERPQLFTANLGIAPGEGARLGSGQKLWKRAKRVIPGGNMLLSKRAEMFLPDRWPTYFSRARGCRVWDLDGSEYIDMSIMGVGTNTLGYGNEEVDAAVRGVVDKGNMSTFNCPEEVYLLEQLLELHPWADMGRLARSGGEANAIAIRIGRAASGRDNVAICGYHGWHDWYLSANLGDEQNLAGHLLPGLEAKGVPQTLRGTVYPFEYNNYEQLEALVDAHEIGVIKMEVSRNRDPESGFLQKIRTLADTKRAVLIFDECTSGFRQTFGGLHKLYGIQPDIAVFGKALGNGYAITATIGRRDVMEAAQSTFISSTFWTERIGPSAALKTLEVMDRLRSWEIITEIGTQIRARWQALADAYGIKIVNWGLPALAGFTVQSESALAYKTLITQEMLAKGFLAGNSVYVCTAHTPEVLDAYFAALDPVFALIKKCEDGREDVTKLLNGPICHMGFKRLN